MWWVNQCECGMNPNVYVIKNVMKNSMFMVKCLKCKTQTEFSSSVDDVVKNWNKKNVYKRF